VSIFIGYVVYVDNQTVPPVRRIEAPVNRLEETYEISTVMFPCNDLKCEAFFYLPRKTDRLPPVIIMAHGFAAQKDFGLDKFAVKFTESGYAVFMFDYRSFGGSEGEPRNLVSPTRHLEDWDGAIEYVIKNLGDKVDVNNIALWGSSFSGGHVIVTAAKSARKDHIKAVISQVPFLSALSSVASFAGAGSHLC